MSALMEQRGYETPNPIWDMDDDLRRERFRERAAKGARATLAAAGAVQRIALPKVTKPLGPVAKRPRDFIMVASETAAPSLQVPWKRIAAEVCAKHRVAWRDMFSTRRSKGMVAARHEAMWRIYNETSLSLPQIGKKFDRDHTTILHAIRKMEALKEREEA